MGHNPPARATPPLTRRTRKVKISGNLLDKVAQTIDRYDLLAPREEVIVALSGGKDSLLLAIALRELGFDVTPVVVDMGYESGWSSRLTGILRTVDFTGEIVKVRTGRTATKREPVTLQIHSRIDILNDLGTIPDNINTPCTYCYSVKVLALSSASKRRGIPKVAFGHHATDAAASLLKEALMHIDRWDDGHRVFDRSNFAALVDRLAKECMVSWNPCTEGLLARVEDLVCRRLIDTDEPPRQRLITTADDVTLIRPLFSVQESEIINAKEQLMLHTEASGCGHGATLVSQTPRQMVHDRVLMKAQSLQLHEHLAELVRAGLNVRGEGMVGARRRRAELLGPTYKPTLNDRDKL